MRVAFFKGRHPGYKGLFGVLVKWWTRGDFSHVELVVEDRGTSGVCWSSTFLDHGVRRAVVDFTPGDWIFVDIPTTAEQDAAALAWFEQHAGEPYDVRGLFGFVLRRIPGEKGKWFCSESVAAALGVEDPWRFDPATFYRVADNWCRMVRYDAALKGAA
jgi:hypothetical protein